MSEAAAAPLRIRLSCEPLSEVGAEQKALGSDALDRLVTELNRYVRGEINGRSFLVAGHRGAGKTTMVRLAIEAVRHPSGQETRGTPLYVPLHGPSLLRWGEGTPARPDRPAEDPAGATGAAASKQDFFAILDGVTSGLYVAAAEEVAGSFRRIGESRLRGAIEDRPWRPRPVYEGWKTAAGLPFRLLFYYFMRWRERAHLQALWRRRARAAEMAELAAEVRATLDGVPSLRRLRELWRRAGVLRFGVLHRRPDREATGSDEIEALVTAWRAMSFFAGKQERKRSTDAEASTEASFSLVTVDGRSLLPALAGIVTGGASWQLLGVAKGAWLEGIAAVVAGLAAALTVGFSLKRTAKVTEAFSEKFEFKDDPESLYRVLPVLIRRFMKIGLYPIFVVDELDKVEDVERKIGELLGRLKQFVTENAFFCFLTDRSYYDRHIAEARRKPYSLPYSFFSDHLYVRYTPRQMLDWVRSMCELGFDSGPSTQRDAELLPYIVLQRAYMHPLDVRRQLVEWTDSAGRLRIPSSDLASRYRFRIDVMLQVAVELLLLRAERHGYLDDPLSAQTIQDALYYAVRRWHNRQEEVDMSPPALAAALREMGGHTAAGKADGQPADPLMPYIQGLLNSLIDWLQNPRDLFWAAHSRNEEVQAAGQPALFPAAVLEVLGAWENRPLIGPVAGGEAGNKK